MSSDTAVQPIPLCVPWLTGNEAAYLCECVDTNWVSSVGPFVTRFETETAKAGGFHTPWPR